MPARPAIISTTLATTAVLATGLALATTPSPASEAQRCAHAERGTSRPDRLIGTGVSERIVGSGGADLIAGRGGGDCLRGGGQRDLLVGGDGRDVLHSGGGRDRIRARDGRRDIVRCGPARDVARIDYKDVARRCERIVRRKPTGRSRGSASGHSGGGGTPPDTTITSGPSNTITTDSASFGFSASEPGSTYECKLDAGGWSPCTSAKSYSGLGNGTHGFSVRAVDPAGNTDPTPASRSFTVATSSIAAGPPSGTIVQADPMTRACPIDGLWGAVSDAHFYVQRCRNWSDAADPQIDYFSSGGFPAPTADGNVHAGYRRLELTNGKQSIYDAGVGNKSYRTQLINNSDNRTYYPMQPGHRYVWWVSVRFQDPTPLTSDDHTDESQIWQIKNDGSCAGSTEVGPIESMAETRNLIELKDRQSDGDVRIDSFPIGTRGVWQMFAFDVIYSNDPTKAAYQLWADQDGDSKLDLEPLTPKLTGRVTAVGPSCIGKPSIGPYQQMDAPAVTRDYGVNQMVEVPVGAHWG